MTTDLATKKETAFRLKGSLFTLTVLQVLQADKNLFEEQLKQMVKQTPQFFRNAPIVLDLASIAKVETPVNFESLIALMRAQGLIPIGVRSGSDAQHESALQAGLAVLPTTKAEEKREPSTISYKPSRLITQPVRSGQQIYAENADLIVVAPVSHGAELLADGHIHVYGALRGRALAGIQGDLNARIFCHTLDAELISIAGRYRLKEDITKQCNQGPSQILLKNDQLVIDVFSSK